MDTSIVDLSAQKIDLLDHGYVRLVDHMGSDLSIIRSARVSYDADWRSGEDEGKDEKLINYLWKNGHTSPFESVTFTFEVKAPIFTFRQWHRHRTQSYNEVSARYTALPEEFYVPEIEQITTQSSSNKQMRTESINDNAPLIQAIIRNHGAEAFRKYQQMLDLGAPRELARSVLPVGTYSRMFATVNLNNLMKFFKERSHPHAQYEIRVYSDAMQKLVIPIVPYAMAAFKSMV